MATKQQGKGKGSPVPEMHPRERLTAKAMHGISTYATVKAGDLPIHGLMVRYVLEAERMPRARLYEWLEGKGYRWNSRVGLWQKSERGAGG